MLVFVVCWFVFAACCVLSVVRCVGVCCWLLCGDRRRLSFVCCSLVVVVLLIVCVRLDVAFVFVCGWSLFVVDCCCVLLLIAAYCWLRVAVLVVGAGV